MTRRWGTPIAPEGPDTGNNPALSERADLFMKTDVQTEPQLRPGLASEQHFKPAEIAERWSISVSKVIGLFENEPGVLRIGQPSRRMGRVLKRGYFTMRIPESVVERVHQRLTGAS
jgi:hypothetical protein